MNWSDPDLQQKLRAAITARPEATWRFVVFSVAPFHSSTEHQNEEWMRVLCPLLEECNVDMVLSSNVHNYQRTYPLRFKALSPRTPTGKVRGSVLLDKEFNGVTNTRPTGILYLVSGAGGGALSSKAYHADNPSGTLQPFTARYIANTHSLTVAEIHDKTLSVRQISEDGKELDRFTVTK